MTDDGGRHASSEDLALLAMDADVDDAVRDHVDSCSECGRNLSLLRSLLDSEGQAVESVSEADSEALDARAATAMADAAEPRPAEAGAPEVPSPPTPQVPAATGSQQPSRSVVGVIVGIVLLVGVMVLVLALWR